MSHPLNPRLRTLVGATILALALAPALAAAQESLELTYDPKTMEVERPEMRIEGDTVDLSIDEAVAFALERNLGLNVQRYSVASGRELISQNQGIYDFNIGAVASAYSEESPSASNLDGADFQQYKGQNLDFTLSQLFPWGGKASFVWDNSRSETNSLFALINPQYRVDTDLKYEQPLLRGFGRLSTERGLLIARNNDAVNRQSFEIQVATTIQSAVNAYWSLVEAKYQLTVAEEGLRLAKELHEQNRIRVDVGTLAPLELVQSEVGIATREEEIIRAQAAVEDAEDELKKLFNIREDAGWLLKIRPDSDPQIEERVDIDLQEALSTAMQERPELSRKELENANLEIESAFYGKQVLPRLDLSVTYGFNGLGGDVTERDFFTQEVLFRAKGGYGDAIEQVYKTDFPGWSIGLTFALPLQNRDAKARKAIANINMDRGDAELEDLKNTVITEVRKAVRAVETAGKQIDSARVSRRLAEKNLEAEKKRYENGLSTSYQVLQIQEDLTQAASRLVTAIATYRRATAEYYRSIGRLLSAHQVALVEDIGG